MPVLLLLILIALAALIVWLGVPYLAKLHFGEPTPVLNGVDRWYFSFQILMGKNELSNPADPRGIEKDFIIESGESINSVAKRLESEGLINDSSAFRAYLIYKGADSQIKAGKFIISPGSSSLEIIESIQSSTSPIVSFYIYPGWRAEEIAAALPSSGIEVSPEAFLNLVHNPSLLADSSEFSTYPSLDGFLYPGVYEINRNVSTEELIRIFVAGFTNTVKPEVIGAINEQGLTLYEGVVLASIIQRETFMDDERAKMASVFYNRLRAGMKLETDPTVQYALGYSSEWGNWWKTPLNINDLGVNSSYNTYFVYGLPPTPISNPALPSILAVAYPEETPYYYFRAECDDSGYHVFSITFEEHLQKECK